MSFVPGSGPLLCHVFGDSSDRGEDALRVDTAQWEYGNVARCHFTECLVSPSVATDWVRQLATLSEIGFQVFSAVYAYVELSWGSVRVSPFRHQEIVLHL